ncbi:MAG: T9SS type A sorting domain-containing protein [Deferribacteres bacterium]|nr:T9SS type A sorting domain-containing protein [candidate division KSB1 bacterium]MCB9501064.1 T9SS type A sorting domain-containing protein [Deferribacteres bacterium]
MKKLIIVTTACLLFFSPLFAGNNFSTIRKYQPVVIKGENITELLGSKPNQLFGYAYDAASNSWRQIPFQVDERRRVDTTVPGPFWQDGDVGGAMVDVPPSLAKGNPEETMATHPAEDLLYVGEGNGIYGSLQAEDSDKSFDQDDEICFMVEDAGDKAPGPEDSWVADTEAKRVEVKVTDPLDNSTGYVYIYVSSKLSFKGQNSVSYALVPPDVEHAADIESDYYIMHYSRRWVLDEVRVKSALGGKGVDLIDQIKFRAYALTPQNETEEFWSDGPGVCGFSSGKGCSKYVGHKTGPVRAIRQIQGAASGPTTSYQAIFYNKMLSMQINYRVHSLPNLWYYMDYSPSVSNIMYYDANNSSVKIDGKQDNVSQGKPSTWSQVSSDEGSLVMWADVHEFAAAGTNVIEPYYLDNSGFNDQTGDDGKAYGNHGLHFEDIPDHDNKVAIVSFLNFYILPPGAADQGSEFEKYNTTSVTLATNQETRKSPIPSAVKESDATTPGDFHLYPAYPNPFQAISGKATLIKFQMQAAQKVEINVYDIKGRLVNTLVRGNREVGTHQLEWNGLDSTGKLLPAGTYYLELRTPTRRMTQQMTLIH